ncbi:hypothetical protein M8J76_001398 [Diaphorina citri]|nr:hypothetical protein M8J76_001398 [Diaphorina citri]
MESKLVFGQLFSFPAFVISFTFIFLAFAKTEEVPTVPYTSPEAQVDTPPVILNNSPQLSVAKEGQSVQLECHAEGHPIPTISWRRENNAILPNGQTIFTGSTLQIPRITKEDRGVYYCVAQNGIGRGARRKIEVKVEFAPIVTVQSTRIGQALHHDMDLDCHIEAYPHPILYWAKDGEIVVNDEYHSISNFGTSEGTTDSIIRIKNIGKSEYGTYACRAMNRLGSAQKSIELYESSYPVCVRGPCITIVDAGQTEEPSRATTEVPTTTTPIASSDKSTTDYYNLTEILE